MDVLVVGPVPPPVDGRAQATSWLIDVLRMSGHHVVVVDTQTSSVSKAWRCLRIAVASLRSPRPDRLVVVASGETGLLAEAIPLLAARLRGIQSSLIHHSAHYVRENSRLLRTVLAAGGEHLRHVALDKAMGAELAARYGIDTKNVVVVDNAGLMPPAPVSGFDTTRAGVVHLSNLSTAKGLDAVLTVASRTNIRIRLIGSITPEAAVVLAEARSAGVPFDADGPLHGEAKHLAFTGARCFLFLSSYVHEAQPLVVYEAARAGCVPVVWRTGWIGEQMDRLGLGEYVLPKDDVDAAVRMVTELDGMDADAFAHISERVRSAFEALHGAASDQFHEIIT